jgi:hypothetical protein
MIATNTLAYYDMEFITALKGFKILVLGVTAISRSRQDLGEKWNTQGT